VSENPEDLDHAELRERIVALEEELDAMEAEPLERAEKELALAQIWGAVGQPNRAAVLFKSAYTTKKKALGPTDPGAVNAALSAAAALRVAGESRQAWLLAQTLEKRIPAGHSERVHVVAVYNQLRPDGFRPASAGGKGAAGKSKGKGRKKRR
jgi:hypothetical protein